MTEIFKTIDNYETYSISSFGRVRNDESGKFLKGCDDSKGYLVVNLYKNGYVKMHKIHRLVALAFIHNPESKNDVDHNDNNPSNNSLENLRWATRQENLRNKQLTATNTSGVKGVNLHKSTQKWRAHITIDGKIIHLGLFSTLEEATLVRQTKANEIFGVFTNSCEKSLLSH